MCILSIDESLPYAVLREIFIGANLAEMPSEEIFVVLIFICTCALPHPPALHVRNVSMVSFLVEAMYNGERVPRLVYNADIWASVVGEEFRKMTNSRLVGGILTDHCCSVNLAHFHLLHFPQPHYRCRLTGVDGSTRVLKRRLYKCNRLLDASMCSITCSKFDVKFRLLKFSVFSRLHTKYTKICTIRKFPAIRYLVI